MRSEKAKSVQKRAMCIFFAKKKRKICKIDCFCRIFASLKATGALVQLVRMPACHAGGRWFESCTHRKTRKQSAPGFFVSTPQIYLISRKILGINYALLPNRKWNQKQKHKKQPWSNVECFAFGGATVRFASLETSFHAANHTIPPPPSHEGYPRCTKEKNRSPFHGEKPLMIT